MAFKKKSPRNELPEISRPPARGDWLPVPRDPHRPQISRVYHLASMNISPHVCWLKIQKSTLLTSPNFGEKIDLMSCPIFHNQSFWHCDYSSEMQLPSWDQMASPERKEREVDRRPVFSGEPAFTGILLMGFCSWDLFSWDFRILIGIFRGI